ncbi:MAG: hypothetical protein Q9165_008336 [Trypethelium subeluteriae]
MPHVSSLSAESPLGERETTAVDHMPTTEMVKNFMEMELNGNIHPALDTTGRVFDKSLHRWLPVLLTANNFEELYADANAAQLDLLKAMEGYQEQVKFKYRVDFEVEAVHDWEEVIGLALHLKDSYAECEFEGAGGKVRDYARKFCDYAKPLKAFLLLLPSESSYVSVLCGGLKLIFGAAERLGTVRTRALKAFEEMLATLKHAQDSVHVFPDDRELHCNLSAIYVCLTHVLKGVIAFFQQKAIKKAFSALWQQKNYQQMLLERMDIFKNRVRVFKERASICAHLRQESIVQAQASMSQDLRNISSAQQQIWHRQQLQLLQGEALDSSFKMISADFVTLSQKFIQDTAANKAAVKLQEIPHSVHALTATKMLEELRNNSSDTGSEYQKIFRTLTWLASKDQIRVSILMANPKIHEWLAANESKPMLVNACISNQYRSPASLVCASLIHSLNDSARSSVNNIITLSFFCGEHLDQERDSKASPAGIILELLGQLLATYTGFDLSEIRQLWRRVQRKKLKDVELLCSIFEALLLQLPESTILFCIVDGISYYEDSTRREQLAEAAKFLIEMTRSVELRATIKVLFTSPMRCIHVWR